MLDKKLDKITNILNEYLQKFDCVAKSDSNFAYISSTNEIHYALILADRYEKTFMAFVNKLFPYIKADPFLWSLYHEIGHHETENDFEEWEEEEYRTKASSNITDEEYYNLPIEYAATAWAGEYMETHQNEINNLWDKLQPAIKDFFKQMNIEEE